MTARNLFALGAIVLALSGCGETAAPRAPQAHISAPTPKQVFELGKPVTIRGQALGEGIARVDVMVDGARVASVVAQGQAQGMTTLPVEAVVWTPNADGTHVVVLHVFGSGEALLAKSEPVVVAVKPSDSSPTSAPATAAPTQAPATPTQVQPTAPPPTPTPDIASLTVTNEFVNVRAGPDVQHALLGRLEQGQTAAVRGKSADGKWWQIAFDKGANGVAWVTGEFVQANASAGGVAVAAAPPLPTRPPVTPTAIPPTSVPATVTPSQPECGPNSPTWKGREYAEYQFCVIEDLRYIEGGGDQFDGGTNRTMIAAWNLSGVETVKLRVTGSPGCGGGASKGGREVVVKPHDTYQFNVNEFSGGYWKVGLFVTTKNRPQETAYGEMYLCIK